MAGYRGQPRLSRCSGTLVSRTLSTLRSMSPWLVLVALAVAVGVEGLDATHNQEHSLRFCEHYTECTAVSRLEERLCMGNTRKRPYWLPSALDPKKCHETLKNDYKLMDHLEILLEKEYLTCLIERTIPMTNFEMEDQHCEAKVLQTAPRFSFARTISYVPTNCFHGLEKRIDKQCGRLRSCCGAVDRCSSILTDSSHARRIEDTRAALYRRAKECERGIPTEPLSIPAEIARNDDDELTWAPKGHINVKFRDQESLRYAQPYQGDDAGKKKGTGTININIFEEEEWAEKQRIERERERLGVVSKPFNLHESKSTKVTFPNAPDTRYANRSLKKTTNGDLTIEPTRDAQPALQFPDNIDVEKPTKPTRRPITIEEHNRLFKEALRNTEAYKKQQNTAKIVKETLGSLFEASDASEAVTRQATDATPLDGTTSAAPTTEESIATAKFGSSDTVEPFPGPDTKSTVLSENEDTVSGGTVTSSPIIIIKTTTTAETPAVTTVGGPENATVADEPTTSTSAKTSDASTTTTEPKGCRPNRGVNGTRGLEKIMEEIGEDPDAPEMKELKGLLGTALRTDIRDRLVEVRKQSTDKKLQELLDILIINFDRVNEELQRAKENATFPSDDYPDGDADIAGSICDPLPENVTSTEELDADNNKILLKDGEEKLVITNGNLALEGAPDEVPHDEGKGSFWEKTEYKKELEEYRKKHHLDSPNTRNDTACDSYMRCRNQMHLALDGCAWRFASSRVLPSLAESAESLLYRGDELCDPKHRSAYEELYELVISRNIRLRKCLEEENKEYFATSVCLPYPVAAGHRYDAALVRVLSSEYETSAQCFHDANLIQEKCSKLRLCCPNYDKCREGTLRIEEEQAIISQTAKVNERKQECLRRKAREQFQVTLRELLGKGGPDVLKKIKSKEFLHGV